MTTINNKPWADQPFSLITSPLAKTGSKDQITKIATEMVCVHNTFIQGLNSMILQAEHVPTSEYSPFISYCMLWSTLLEDHHTTEEEYFFGALDKKYGEGTMQESLDEHAAFHEGVERFQAYLQSLARREETFNSSTLIDLINAFANPLLHHFNSEITTILALARFPEADIQIIYQSTLDEAVRKLNAGNLVTDLPYIYRNNDLSFENGIHANFPPLPLPMRVLGRYVFCWWHWRL